MGVYFRTLAELVTFCHPNHKGKRGRTPKSEDEASPAEDEDKPKGRGTKLVGMCS